MDVYRNQFSILGFYLYYKSRYNLNVRYSNRAMYCNVFVLLLFIQTNVIAQSSIDSIKYPQKDIIDVLLLQSKDTSKIKKATTNGDGPFYSIMPAAGYTMLNGLTGLIIANASFYADSVHSKFSNILLNCAYSQYKQYWFTLNTSFYFEKYKLHFVSDTRYYKFPTQTYGLSIYSTFADKL